MANDLDDEIVIIKMPGAQGPRGIPGPTGPQGPAGAGFPAGGTTGQVLTKIDNVDYNATWVSPVKVRYTTGDVYLSAADHGTIFISTDSSPVNFYLPSGLPTLSVKSLQGGSGQISYIPTNGASVVDGVLRSKGQYSDKYCAIIDSFGDGTYFIGGDTTAGVLKWSIVGQTNVRQGDSCIYVIWRPDVTAQYPSGVTLTVTGTGFDTAGFDQNLVQALTNLTLLEPGVTFDGVSQLTILPTARNPLPLWFFAQPGYTATGNKNVSITISNPSAGTIADTAGTVNTLIQNVSRPTAPSELFPTTTTTLTTAATTGATTITVADASTIKKYSTIRNASIPSLTYVTNISGNVITLSAGLSGNIAQGGTITIVPPGYHFDFTTSTGMTLDGSNRCSQVLDKINGYPLTQATQANQPTYVANSLNGLGGLNFNSSKRMTSSNPALAKIADDARARFTVIYVGVLSSFTNTATLIDGPVKLQANSTLSAFNQAVATTGLQEVTSASSVGIPAIWMYENDGTVDGGQVHCNNQRIYVPATVTALSASGQRVVTLDDTSNLRAGMCVMSPPYGGLKTTIPSTVGCVSGNVFKITSVDSATQVTLNQNLVENLVVGQPIQFYSNIDFNRPISTAKNTTSIALGSDVSGSNSMNGIIYQEIFIPRILSIQEKRGVHLYLSNLFATTIQTTTTAPAAAGTQKLVVSNASNIRLYQTVSGTNIKPGSTVVKINTTTKEVWLDEKILTGGVASSAVITFTYCGIKIPDQINVAAMTPLFRADFVTGAQFANSGNGFRPYSGDPNNPGTFNGAYGILGHGSSNNGSAELEWNLDVLNWAPWRSYNPFSQFTDSQVPKGGLKITASPTPPEIAALVGYAPAPPPPQPYPYISGYMRDAGGFNQQYGYWESRIKTQRVIGVWTAFWLLATNGGYPPEIDIWEGYGFSCSSIQNTNHMCKTFNLDFLQRAAGTDGELLVDFSEEYVLFGADVTPDKVVFYINREKIWSITMQWDMHTPWYMILDMAVQASQGASAPDKVTAMSMWIDYAAVWRYPDQIITPSGATQPETTALLAAMTVQPSAGRIVVINRMIEKLKLYTTSFGVSLWNSLDFLIVPAAHDAQAGRIDWKNPVNIGSVVGTPTFTTDRGYAGTLNTSYIDMGAVLSSQSYQLNSTLNQSHVGAIAANITRTDAIACGTTKFNITPQSGNAMKCSLWTNTAKSTSTLTTGGHYLATRNHFQYTYYQNGILTSGKPSTGDDVHTVDVDTLKFANGTSQVAIAHGGDYLTQDDVRYLYAVMLEYCKAVGAL